MSLSDDLTDASRAAAVLVSAAAAEYDNEKTFDIEAWADTAVDIN